MIRPLPTPTAPLLPQTDSTVVPRCRRWLMTSQLSRRLPLVKKPHGSAIWPFSFISHDFISNTIYNHKRGGGSEAKRSDFCLKTADMCRIKAKKHLIWVTSAWWCERVIEPQTQSKITSSDIFCSNFQKHCDRNAAVKKRLAETGASDNVAEKQI